VLYLAALADVVCALFNLRLPQPNPAPPEGSVQGLGRLPALGLAALGAGGLRAAQGFLLFLLAFALRRSGLPTWWFGVLALCGVAGGFVGDLLAPRLPPSLREDHVVLGALAAAGVAAVAAARLFALPVLAIFAAVAGLATEMGRLAFQSLMQRLAPGPAQGRVFVRYEVAFQLAWVAGALIPAVVDVSFRTGIVLLAGFYLLLGLAHEVRPRLQRGQSNGTPVV